MLALLFSLAAFLFWCVIGVAALVAVRAELESLRVVLTAPVVGSAATVLPLVFLSNAGVSMDAAALPTIAVLLIASVVLLVVRRPRIPHAAWPVFGIALAVVFLVGRPMLVFGFHWIANANDDMANYVLSATLLQHHGLIAPLDVAGLSHDRDYATAVQTLHSAGARPGANIALAAFASLTRRLPYELFMPLSVALELCGVCAAGALAMQATRRAWAASIAALLLALSPLAAYGVVQQLLPQVWGLGLAVALCALLMRPELHGGPGPRWGDVALVGGLAAALVAVYVELASTILFAYGVYVAVLAIRRKLGWRALVRLWAPAVLIVLVALNTYLVRELSFVSNQARAGFGSGGKGIFDYSLVPAALPAILGFVKLGAVDASTPHLSLTIALSMAVLAGVMAAVLVWTWRGMAAAAVLLADLVIGIALASRSNGFGLFKLYMYVQPFLAAAGAVWLAELSRRWALVVGSIAISVFMLAELGTQRLYVNESRSAAALRNASAADMLPAFRQDFDSSRVPVVSVADNPVLGKLEATMIGNRRLYFVGRDLFSVGGVTHEKRLKEEIRQSERLTQWKRHTFDLKRIVRPRTDPFFSNANASAVLASGRCLIVMSSGTQYAVNRQTFPEGSPDLVKLPCSRTRNLLAFTVSPLGQSYYIFTNRRLVSFYQLEPDYFFRGRTFMGFGRYALFRVLTPSTRVRLELDLTRTVMQDRADKLPPVAVVGSSRARLPLVGRGSARVFSRPIRPQMIDGEPYILVDMGVDGRQQPVPISGLEKLYGRGVALDPRYLTAYVRDVSLVSEAQYDALKVPAALRSFPADLGNPDFEYSGIYEDGWVGDDAYVFLAAGPAADLVVRAEVPQMTKQRLTVLVDGRTVSSVAVKPGELDLRMPVPAASVRRKVELRWTDTVKLNPPDSRPVAARLEYLGLSPR